MSGCTPWRRSQRFSLFPISPRRRARWPGAYLPPMLWPTWKRWIVCNACFIPMFRKRWLWRLACSNSSCRTGMTGHVIRAGTIGCLVLLAMGASGFAEAVESDFLSDQPELIQSSTQGWGTLGFDVAADDSPLRIAEKRFAKGLGTHANGVIVLMADGQYASLDAEVGLQ